MLHQPASLLSGIICFGTLCLVSACDNLSCGSFGSTKYTTSVVSSSLTTSTNNADQPVRSAAVFATLTRNALQVTSAKPILPKLTATSSGSPVIKPRAQEAAQASPSVTPCDFADENDLISNITHNPAAYNITQLVQTCPVICDLVYGGENPDVSGIGVLISYIVQFVAIAIFGPYLLVILSFDCLDQPYFRHLVMALKEISASVHEASVFLALSISVAAIIRLSQRPPLFEAAFVRHLVYLQLLFVFAIGYAHVKLFGLHWRRGSGMIVVSTFVTGALTITAYAMSVWSSNDAVLGEISNQCIVRWNFPRQNTLFENEAISTVFEIVGVALIVVIAGRLFISARHTIKAMPWMVRLHKSRFWPKIKPGHFLIELDRILWTLEKHWLGKTFLIINTATWTACCIYFIFFLQKQRTRLYSIDGKLAVDVNDNENYWGFAQVAAVLAWLPVVHEIGVQVHELWDRRGNNELVFEEIRERRSHELRTKGDEEVMDVPEY